MIFLGPGQKTLPPGPSGSSTRVRETPSPRARSRRSARSRRGSHAAARSSAAAPPAPSGRPDEPASASAPIARAASGADNGDFTTVERYDAPDAPALTANDDFFEFLFSGSEVNYADLKDKVSKGEPLPAVALKGVKITINVDADYTVVRTRLTRNVVGIVQGTDPKLRDTYVAFGAHYDHIGYTEASGEPSRSVGDVRHELPGTVAGYAAPGRQHQQRGRRRRVGDRGADGAREGVRAGAEAEAVAAVRVALRRGGGALRVAVLRRLSRSSRSTRSRRSSTST